MAPSLWTMSVTQTRIAGADMVEIILVRIHGLPGGSLVQGTDPLFPIVWIDWIA
jgi:hypothetical protein